MTDAPAPHPIDTDALRKLCEAARLPDKDFGTGVFSTQDWGNLWAFYRAARDALPAILDELDRLRAAEAAGKNWRDDPSADDRWNAGCDFAMHQLCKVMDVDPDTVCWDAATETLDGDVQSVIWGILRKNMGDDWSPKGARAEIARLTDAEAENDEQPDPFDETFSCSCGAQVRLRNYFRPDSADVCCIVCASCGRQSEETWYHAAADLVKKWKAETPSPPAAADRGVPGQRVSDAALQLTIAFWGWDKCDAGTEKCKVYLDLRDCRAALAAVASVTEAEVEAAHRAFGKPCTHGAGDMRAALEAFVANKTAGGA